MRMSIEKIRNNISAKLRIIPLGYVSSCFIKAHTNDFLINELKKGTLQKSQQTGSLAIFV
jgi:hypothetical protein